MVGGEGGDESDLVLCYVGEQPPLPGPLEQMVDKGLKLRRVAGIFTRDFLQKAEKGCVTGLIDRMKNLLPWGALVREQAL